MVRDRETGGARRASTQVTNVGLHVQRLEALHEFQNMHQIQKMKLHRFVRGHFYGNLNFDLDKTLYVFTAGRREFTNKGVDMYLEALARLNAMLIADKSDVTVVAFVIMPGESTTYNVETLEGQSVMRDLQMTADQITADIGGRMMAQLARGVLPPADSLLRPEHVVELKQVCMCVRA
jgi:glycogen(starch) synthase